MIIEGLRTDSLMVGHLRISQLVAGICVVISIAAIIYKRNKIRVDGEYVFYKDTEESKHLIAETEEKYRVAEEKRAAKKKAKSDAVLDPKDRLVDDEPEENTLSKSEEENTDGTDN